MSRSWFLVAVSATAMAFGCSHEQKPAATSVTARVVAVAPPAPRIPPARPPVAQAPEGLKPKEGDAIYFDFDSAVLRDDALPVLQQVAEKVRSSDKALRIEGNCDEVGTVEYNLALGEHRARAAQEYLVHMGVPGGHIATVSYGSQRTKYPGHDETAHARNRRDDLLVR